MSAPSIPPDAPELPPPPQRNSGCMTALLLLLNLPTALQIAIATVSTLSIAAGVLTERWLFFAEAEHVAMLYYRGGAA